MSYQSEDSKNSAGLIIAITLIFSIGYAVLRYHIFGLVPWKDFPFFILNKGISLSAFILLAFNFSFGPLKKLGVRVPESWLNTRKTLGMSGFLLVLIHAMISLILLNPMVYGKFFYENETLTLLAQLSMLGGILAFVFLWGYNLSFQTHARKDNAFTQFFASPKFLIIAITLGAVHLFFMGYKDWINPSDWHGGLPPISLVAIVFFVSAYTINLLGRN